MTNERSAEDALLAMPSSGDASNKNGIERRKKVAMSGSPETRLLINACAWIVALLCATVCRNIFKKKNRSPALGGVMGLILGPIGIVIAVILDKKQTNRNDESGT